MKKSELKQLIKESIRQILKEEIKEFKGKRYKKQPNGKWMEVSEYDMTKKEHQMKGNSVRHEYYKKGDSMGDWDKNKVENASKHFKEASKLSDKEYDENELTEATGVNNNFKMKYTPITKSTYETSQGSIEFNEVIPYKL